MKSLSNRSASTASTGCRTGLVLALVIALMLLVGCQQTPEPVTVLVNPSPSPETMPPTNPFNGDGVVPGQPIADDTALRLMADLSQGDEAMVMAALQSLLTANDERYVPVLIELLRFGQIGIAPSGQVYVDALEQISGQSFGMDWPAWVEWYGGTDIVPPPGFTGWKGDVLGRLDPGFQAFLQDDFPSNIRVEEIQWGGVMVDGIPALEQPTSLPAAAATYLTEDEPVFGIALNGEARAYPLRILDWHEMANDTVGGIPVSLAYCTLCGAAIAYDGRASNGETYDFGSSGFLFRSNKLMYDRQTRTLWNQLTGEPVLGPLVDDNVTLSLLPVVLTSWGEWRSLHPETSVVDINTGHRRPYELGAAYGSYFADVETMFPVWQRNDLLETKEQVYALRVDGQPIAYPIDSLASEQVINDTVGTTNLVLVAHEPVIASGVTRSGDAVAYSAGSEVRAYDRGDHTFVPGPDTDVVMDELGRQWQVEEEALIGPNGQSAARVPGHLAYWFGWYSFFPDTLVYGVD